jgi:DNA invertase Pin-like site-specific DNA recombinase
VVQTFSSSPSGSLARSIVDLMAILQALERKRVIVRILKLGLDTQTPGGKLRPRVLGGVAQLEPNT